MMILIAVSFVNRAFARKETSINFLRALIILLVIIGIALGVAACYLSKLIWLVEILIAPALFLSIRGYVSADKDYTTLLNEANITLRGARKQAEIEHRIKKEIRQGK